MNILVISKNDFNVIEYSLATSITFQTTTFTVVDSNGNHVYNKDEYSVMVKN